MQIKIANKKIVKISYLCYNNTMEKQEKALLVCPYVNMENSDYRTSELKQLAESALLDIVGCELFLVKEVNARTYMGSGKVEELRDKAEAMQADVLIFDCPLTGSQLRNLGDIIDCKVIDRTMLILDIFAGRAKTSEGKLQVKLAQLKYSLPRLSSLASNKNRSGSGVGMRGSGETELELDRRKVQAEIVKLEREVKEVQKRRQTTRKQRLTYTKTVSLVGYTNAGKSTLMNTIAKADTYADDRLFATLDVLTKKVWDEGVEYVLVDTVGFVSNLPHELMYAFSATLEETLDADVLVMVVDASDKNKYDQIEVVEREFKRLEIDPNCVILVYNKVDKISEEERKQLKDYPYDTCYIAAKSAKNIVQLKQMIRNKLSERSGGYRK